MALLLGEVGYVLKGDFNFVFSVEILDYEVKPEDKLLPEGGCHLRMKGAEFTLKGTAVRTGGPASLI